MSRARVDGYQDLDAKRPVDADTIYRWASITKTFTGIAIMQLRDRGLLSLEEMWKPQIRALDGEGASGDAAQAGLSFFLERHVGLDLIAHSGDQNGLSRTTTCTALPGPRTIVSFNTDVSASKTNLPSDDSSG